MATPAFGEDNAPAASFPALTLARLRWGLPALTVFLLAAATLALFALSSTKERGEAREQLVADTLWVRESLQFQLDRETEALQLVAVDLEREALAPAALQARFAAFLRRAREALSVALVERVSVAIQRADREGAGGDSLAQVPAAIAESAMARARRDGRPQFGAPFQASFGPAMALFVPVGKGGGEGDPEGRFLVAVFHLERLLDEMVPWSYAQENEVTLGDVTGTVRARRASAGRGRGVYTNQEALELPGATLVLNGNSIKGPPDWIANALRGGVAALAALLLWSLWALWRDVGRRVRAEHRLREEVAFRRAMGDSAVIGLRARDLEGRIVYVNPAFCRMVGFCEEDLVGHGPPLPYWSPDYREDYQRRMQEVLSGRVTTEPYETTFQRRGGEEFPVVIYDAPLRDADGAHTGWMSSILDVSEQKRVEERERLREERLHTAARLTTMGEMASSLAHELNQPLGAIASYLAGSINLLEKNDAPPGELREALAKAASQAQRAGQVIRRVHEFVRKQEPKRMPVAIAALLEDCRALVELQARREGVQVTVEVERDLPVVNGDPVMLQQVVLNLTRNAVEAMASVAPELRRLEITATSTGEHVRITVRDHGSGIPEEVAAQLFSPFFTTKPEGMGMGLSICRSIAEAHGGRLWFERLEVGTQLHLQVPAAP